MRVVFRAYRCSHAGDRALNPTRLEVYEVTTADQREHPRQPNQQLDRLAQEIQTVTRNPVPSRESNRQVLVEALGSATRHDTVGDCSDADRDKIRRNLPPSNK